MDNVTEGLAAHRRLIVNYYPEFFANLTTLPIVERLIYKPLQVISISSKTAITQPVDDLIQLRGIRVLDVERRGSGAPDPRVNDIRPDGILCFCDMSDAAEVNSGGLPRLAGNLQSRLLVVDTPCPAFVVVPTGLSNAFTQAFETLGGNAHRVQILPAKQSPGEAADGIFQDVYRYCHTGRGGLNTIDIATRSRSGRPDAVLLEMDWQSRLSTTRFPSPAEWQEIFMPALVWCDPRF